MKICILNPTILIKRPVSELAYASNQKITVFTPKQKSHDRKEHHLKYLKKTKVVTFPYVKPPVEFEWAIPGLCFWKQLKQLEKENDALHAWTYFYLHTLIAVWYFKKKGKKVIVTLDTVPGESFEVGGVFNTLFRIYNRTLGKWLLNRADYVTVYGTPLVPFLRKLGVKTAIKVIPTGIHKQKKEHSRDLRKELKLKDKKIVTFIGLVGKRKGIDYVIETAKLMPQTIFLVVGDAPKRKSWQNKSPNNVLYLGRRNDIFSLLSISDVFFFPSRAEGLPGVVMEAMLAKVPVVTNNIPCTNELLAHKQQGLLCEVGNMKQYKASIELLLHNKRVKDVLVKNAFKRITTTYNWERVTKLYEELYQ